MNTLPLDTVFENRNDGMDRSRHVTVAGLFGRASSETEHAAEDTARGLDGLLDLAKVFQEDGGVDPIRFDVGLHLLDQRQNRPKCIVEIVRDSASQIRNRV